MMTSSERALYGRFNSYSSLRKLSKRGRADGEETTLMYSPLHLSHEVTSCYRYTFKAIEVFYCIVLLYRAKKMT